MNSLGSDWYESIVEHAADPNPPDEVAPPPRPRNVARKSAAIPPPGQRRNRGLRGLGTSASRASPPATAPPEPMHAGSPTMTGKSRLSSQQISWSTYTLIVCRATQATARSDTKEAQSDSKESYVDHFSVDTWSY